MSLGGLQELRGSSWGVPGVPGGSLGVPWELPGGSPGGPWRILGGPWGTWGSLGDAWGIPGGSLGRSVGRPGWALKKIDF